MLKVFLVAVMFFVTGSVVNSQETFSIFYKSHQKTTAFKGAESSSDSAYIIPIAAADSTHSLELLKLDSKGQVTELSSIGSDSLRYNSNACKKIDNKRFVSVFDAKNPASGKKYLELIGFDDQLNVKWRHQYRIEGGSDPSLIVNGNSYVVAANMETGGKDRIYVFKTDSTGKINWDVVFGGASKGEWLGDICLMPGSSYWVQSNYRNSLNIWQRITRISSNGKITGQQKFEYKDGARSGRTILPNSDTSAIIGGYSIRHDSNYSHADVFPYLECFDVAGKRLWSKQFSKVGDIWDGVITANGQYVYAGGAESSLFNIYESKGGLISVDGRGNEGWKRKIPLSDNNAAAYGILKNVTQTSDKGFLCTGVDFKNKNAWILKVDSSGQCNDTTNCYPWLTTGVTMQPSLPKMENTKVYQNPAKNQVKIASQSTIKEITVFDMAGRRLKSYQANSGTLTLNLDTIHRGFYLLEIRTAENICTAKVVVK